MFTFLRKGNHGYSCSRLKYGWPSVGRILEDSHVSVLLKNRRTLGERTPYSCSLYFAVLSSCYLWFESMANFIVKKSQLPREKGCGVHTVLDIKNTHINSYVWCVCQYVCVYVYSCDEDLTYTLHIISFLKQSARNCL